MSQIDYADEILEFDDEEMFCNLSFRVLADEPPDEKQIFLLMLQVLGDMALDHEWDLDDLLSQMFTKDKIIN